MIAAMCMMAYGFDAADTVEEYCQLSGLSSMKSLKEFTRGVGEKFRAEYLRSPSVTNLERLLRINDAREFSEMVASIYCQHYEWKICPTILAGADNRKEKNRLLSWKA